MQRCLGQGEREFFDRVGTSETREVSKRVASRLWRSAGVLVPNAHSKYLKLEPESTTERALQHTLTNNTAFSFLAAPRSSALLKTFLEYFLGFLGLTSITYRFRLCLLGRSRYHCDSDCVLLDMNEDSYSDQSYDAVDPRKDSANIYQRTQTPGLRSLTSLARHGPESDDISNSGNDFSQNRFNNNSHIPDLKAPTALRSFAGFSNPSRVQIPMPSSGTPQSSARLALNKLALKGQNTHLRSGESLQQRLNTGQRMDEDSGLSLYALETHGNL